MAKLVKISKVKRWKDRQTIKLKDINETWGALSKANSIIQHRLPKNIIFSGDPYLIAFHSLDVYSFGKGKYSFNNIESVQKQCKVILQRYGIYKNGKNESVFEKNHDETEDDTISHFVREIVGFRKMPSTILAELEGQVKINLRELLALISFYETDAIIVNYKQGIRRPEHKSKVVIDFYERCLSERDHIVKYLANELENRAILKACQDDRFRTFGLLWYEHFWDYPYKWWQHRSIEYFDYRKINVCRHRLGEVTVKQIPEFETLYRKNKKLYYRKLKPFLSPRDIFKQLREYYIPILPKVIQRKPIFEELEKLLNAKHWYAFTALALTQVEGIFSDMLNILHPQKNFASLSSKVFAVRAHYKYEERNFDYFEYHLPFLRNAFLHTGSIRDNDFRLLSLDLLYDLHYLLRVFHEISDPHMELHKLLRTQSIEMITGLNTFNNIFHLVAQVRARYKDNPEHQELKQTLAEWNHYEKDILSPSTELEYYIVADANNIHAKITNFFERIKIQAAYDGHKLDLTSAKMPYFTQQISFIKETLKNYLSFLDEEYKSLVGVSTFIKEYKHYLPNCPKPLADQIAETQRKYKSDFSKLHLLKPAFEQDD